MMSYNETLQLEEMKDERRCDYGDPGINLPEDLLHGTEALEKWILDEIEKYKDEG